MTTFTAKYRGARCDKCGHPIEIGDEIVMDVGALEWGHAKCPVRADDLTPRNPVCTVCWLDHPEGRCDR